MTDDFREAEADTQAGHHANLYTHLSDPKQLSADRAVREFLAAGVPPSKPVLGVPFYDADRTGALLGTLFAGLRGKRAGK